MKCSKHHCDLSVTELRELAYQFAKKVNAEYPASWDEDSMAGMKWYRLFMKRHKALSLRTPEQASLNRVKSTSLSSLVAAVDPSESTTPKQLSERGRKPMKSAMLTSPEFLFELKEKPQKRDDVQNIKKERAQKTPTKVQKPAAKTSKRAATIAAARTPAKRGKKKGSPLNPAEEDDDFCIICLESMPRKLTSNNSIRCNSCQLTVHLKCANMQASYFTCKNCDSDYEEEAEFSQE